MKRSRLLRPLIYGLVCSIASGGGMSVLIYGCWQDPGLATYPDRIICTGVIGAFALAWIGLVTFNSWMWAGEIRAEDADSCCEDLVLPCMSPDDACPLREPCPHKRALLESGLLDATAPDWLAMYCRQLQPHLGEVVDLPPREVMVRGAAA